MNKPIEYEVKCVITERDVDGSDRIIQIGGNDWQEKLSDVLLKIGIKSSSYYTMIDGQRADILVVRPAIGDPYLRTSKDGHHTNNLLRLRPCANSLSTGM